MREKVLVTGTAGFIGMHTAIKLSESGYEVVGLDNLNEYYSIDLKLARLRKQGIDTDSIVANQIACEEGQIGFIKMDLEDKDSLFDLFESQKFDYVINLAAQAGVRYSLDHPQNYIDSNITGFLNILECCRAFPIKHLVYASTSSIYGLNRKVPFVESDPTEHQVSFYAASKKANEMMAHSYAHLFDIPSTGLRFFTVYGPWGRPDMALFKFTKNILEGKPIDVYNQGEMQRDFTYVDDIVSGITKVMTYAPCKKALEDEVLKTNDSPAPFAIFNIGNGKPVQLMDFIKSIEGHLKMKAEINFMPMQAGDVSQTYASTENLYQAVGYRPSTSLQEGVGNFIDWYKSFYSG